jgi:hypothetical protein
MAEAKTTKADSYGEPAKLPVATVKRTCSADEKTAPAGRLFHASRFRVVYAEPLRHADGT